MAKYKFYTVAGCYGYAICNDWTKTYRPISILSRVNAARWKGFQSFKEAYEYLEFIYNDICFGCPEKLVELKKIEPNKLYIFEERNRVTYENPESGIKYLKKLKNKYKKKYKNKYKKKLKSIQLYNYN